MNVFVVLFPLRTIDVSTETDIVPRYCKYLVTARGVFKPCQTSKTERFAKIVNVSKPLTIFAKYSILHVWQVSEYDTDGKLDVSAKNVKYVWHFNTQF